MRNEKQLVFLCGARDFHAMDWYSRAVKRMGYSKVSIMTDLIESEGFPRLINKNDKINKMIIIDSFLFKVPSNIGNIWRNIVKLLVLPFQVIILNRFFKKNNNIIFYAHSMYYIFLAYLAGVEFVGRPQGSDILIKPFNSRIYKKFSTVSMLSAKYIIIDSINMNNVIIDKMSSDINTMIIPNGIDIKSINSIQEQSLLLKKVNNILSVRGLTSLYRINDVIESRNNSKIADWGLSFIYPFFDNKYKKSIKSKFMSNDLDIGRLEKDDYYKLLVSSPIAISVPDSDSSPRSVFEAIFCGCAVIITHHSYYDTLPECMKERIIIVNLDKNNWFENAITRAKLITNKKFVPTKNALQKFDENNTFDKMYDCIFDS